MAVAHVPAPIERRHAQGFGQRQAVSFERSATQCRRTGRGPGRNETQRNGESPQPPQNEPVKGPAPRPGDCAWRRYPRPAGFGTAQQGRSESRMPVRAPVTKLREAGRKAGGLGPDIGRQARAAYREAEGPPNASQETERPRVGESGVGSNAGPICCVRPRFDPVMPSPHRVARREFAEACPVHDRLRHHFTAFAGRFVPQQHRLSDDPLPQFAFGKAHDLPAAPCGREIA
jgi:hypothetical protein